MVITIRLMCKLMTSLLESMEELSFEFGQNDQNFQIKITEQRQKLLAIRVSLREIAEDLRQDQDH